jgi:hypothetical protein
MTHIAPAVWCDVHEKWGYTRNQAKKVRRRMPDDGLKIYPCKGRFHVGHSVGPNDKRYRKEAS